MPRVASVDEYIELHPERAGALRKLRKVLLGAGLEETIKWSAPCYTRDGQNVVGLAAFQKYVGLWFHQGVFLKDPDQVLVNAQEGKTKALRQWRFESEKAIPVRKVQAYVREAMENQAAGKQVKPQRKAAGSKAKASELPAELAQGLSGNKAAKAAFAKLTPGRQREYAEYIASAKREATRLSRVEKVLPMIEAGVGLNDRYR